MKPKDLDMCEDCEHYGAKLKEYCSLVNIISEKITDSFNSRFPKMDEFDQQVVIGALIASLGRLSPRMHPEVRKIFYYNAIPVVELIRDNKIDNKMFSMDVVDE